MTDLPTIVLLVGLAAGALSAFFAIRGKASRNAERLRVADLELQLQELYRELRNDGLPDSERHTLEQRAAHTLKSLKELGRRPPPDEPASRATAQSSTEPAAIAPPPQGFTRRHPVLVGALLGGGMVGLVAVLIALAFRDTGIGTAAPAATETAATTSPARPMAGASSDAGSFRGEPQLPPIVAQQIDALREQLVLTPTDLGSRHQLIELLLAHEQHFDAFQEANTLLEVNANDPVGHYAAGFVRFIMGQVEPALEHLRTAVETDPSYTQAWLVRGLILLQTGAREQATTAWRRGLEAAGGSEPRLEHLLAQTARGLSFEEVVRQPPPQQP